MSSILARRWVLASWLQIGRSVLKGASVLALGAVCATMLWRLALSETATTTFRTIRMELQERSEAATTTFRSIQAQLQERGEAATSAFRSVRAELQEMLASRPPAKALATRETDPGAQIRPAIPTDPAVVPVADGKDEAKSVTPSAETGETVASDSTSQPEPAPASAEDKPPEAAAATAATDAKPARTRGKRATRVVKRPRPAESDRVASGWNWNFFGRGWWGGKTTQ